MDNNIVLRDYRAEDCADIMQLFYNTVHNVNAADYTEQQLDAWAPKEIDMAYWNKELIQDHTIVAEKDGVIIGFATLKSFGYLDLFFVHKDYQRLGVATLLADDAEKYCQNISVNSIFVDASITSRPFFEKRGYVVLKEQTVNRRGQVFTNFKMSKEL